MTRFMRALVGARLISANGKRSDSKSSFANHHNRPTLQLNRNFGKDLNQLAELLCWIQLGLAEDDHGRTSHSKNREYFPEILIAGDEDSALIKRLLENLRIHRGLHVVIAKVRSIMTK